MSQPDTTPVDAPVVIVRNNKVPPKVGGMVLYVLSEKDSPTSPGKYRPAIIVDFNHEGHVILQVFTNGGIDQLAPVHRVVGAWHDEDERKNGTWHWPPPRQLVFEAQMQQVPTEPAPEDKLTVPELPFPIANPPPGFGHVDDDEEDHEAT